MLQQASPERFVYHVSRPTHRLDILFEGIRPFPTFDKKHVLVFVNNHPNHCSTSEFWPLPIDQYDMKGDYGNYFEKAFNSQYDYWRIDTGKLDVSWYIDPYMVNDYKVYYNKSSPEFFLCTPSVIPIDAIDLLEYDMDGYNRFGQLEKGEHPELVFSEFNEMLNRRRNRKRKY